MQRIDVRALLGPWLEENRIDLNGVPVDTVVYIGYDQTHGKIIHYQRRVPSASGVIVPGKHGEIELEWCEAPLVAEPSMELQFSGILANPPGSISGELPESVLRLFNPSPYLSTACETAEQLEAAASKHKADVDKSVARAWANRLHERCRLNHKFTGHLCTCPHHTA